MSYLIYSGHKPQDEAIQAVLLALHSREMQCHSNNEYASLQCLKANLEDLALFKAILKSRNPGCLENLPSVLSPITSLRVFMLPKYLIVLKYVQSVFSIGRRFYDIWKDVAAFQVCS